MGANFPAGMVDVERVEKELLSALAAGKYLERIVSCNSKSVTTNLVIYQSDLSLREIVKGSI